jgi:transcriptional regulator with XRE-family HTH domain
MIPVLIHNTKLNAAKGGKKMTYREIAALSGKAEQTICDVLAGRSTVELQSIAAIAQSLGLRVVVDFVPLAEVAETSSQVGLATSQA